jgi:PAS domain S-box-containing protein
VGIFRSSPNGDAVYVNEFWSVITGMPPDQAMGKGWLDAVHPEDREKVASGWSKAVNRGESSSAEFRFLRPDGTIAWVSGRAVQLRDASDKVAGYIGTVADITEQKQAEEMLRKAHDELELRVRERTVELVQTNAALQDEIRAHKHAEMALTEFAAIVESSSDAIMSRTLDDIITSWNEGAERMLGYTLGEIIGQSASIIIPADRAHELKPILKRLRRGETIEPLETVRVRKDGRRLDVSLTLSPI